MWLKSVKYPMSKSIVPFPRDKIHICGKIGPSTSIFSKDCMIATEAGMDTTEWIQNSMLLRSSHTILVLKPTSLD